MGSHGEGSVDVTVDGAIGVVTLANPDRLNAMTLAMWGQLGAAAERLQADPDVRVVVVRGAGENAFSAGADISSFARERASSTANEAYNELYVGALRALASIRKPVLALLRGVCAGGGAGIALSCRIRFCDPGLRFSIPAGRLGIVYDEHSAAQLVEAVGASRALDILVSGRTIGAEEALAIGLVNAVFAEGTLEEEALAYARTVAEGAPLSIEAACVAVQLSLDPGNEELRLALADLERRAADSADYQEGIRAFLEKRRAVFSGR
jgi:enoyl-CoA hydratase/carnithine racemase